MPKFNNTIAWQQAELLMQPVFIRVIDNLGKQLEAFGWKGTYEDTPIWASTVSEEVKALVKQLREQMAIATPDQTAEIEEALTRLPQPAPGYVLRLEKRGAFARRQPATNHPRYLATLLPGLFSQL